MRGGNAWRGRSSKEVEGWGSARWRLPFWHGAVLPRVRVRCPASGMHPASGVRWQRMNDRLAAVGVVLLRAGHCQTARPEHTTVTLWTSRHDGPIGRCRSVGGGRMAFWLNGMTLPLHG